MGLDTLAKGVLPGSRHQRGNRNGTAALPWDAEGNAKAKTADKWFQMFFVFIFFMKMFMVLYVADWREFLAGLQTPIRMLNVYCNANT